MNAKESNRRSLMAATGAAALGAALVPAGKAEAKEYSKRSQAAVTDFIKAMSAEKGDRLILEKKLGVMLAQLASECGVKGLDSRKSKHINKSLESMKLARAAKWYREILPSIQ